MAVKCHQYHFYTQTNRLQLFSSNISLKTATPGSKTVRNLFFSLKPSANQRNTIFSINTLLQTTKLILLDSPHSIIVVYCQLKLKSLQDGLYLNKNKKHKEKKKKRKKHKCVWLGLGLGLGP